MYTVYGQKYNILDRINKWTTCYLNFKTFDLSFSISNNFPECDHDSTNYNWNRTDPSVVPNTVFEMKWDIDAVQICSPQQ